MISKWDLFKVVQTCSISFQTRVLPDSCSRHDSWLQTKAAVVTDHHRAGDRGFYEREAGEDHRTGRWGSVVKALPHAISTTELLEKGLEKVKASEYIWTIWFSMICPRGFGLKSGPRSAILMTSRHAARLPHHQRPLPGPTPEPKLWNQPGRTVGPGGSAAATTSNNGFYGCMMLFALMLNQLKTTSYNSLQPALVLFIYSSLAQMHQVYHGISIVTRCGNTQVSQCLPVEPMIEEVWNLTIISLSATKKSGCGCTLK